MKKNPALRVNRFYGVKRAIGLMGLTYLLVGVTLSLVRRVTWPKWLKARFQKRPASRAPATPSKVADTGSQESVDAVAEPVGEGLNQRAGDRVH